MLNIILYNCPIYILIFVIYSIIIIVIMIVETEYADQEEMSRIEQNVINKNNLVNPALFLFDLHA